MERSGQFAVRAAHTAAKRTHLPHARTACALYSSASEGGSAPSANADQSAKQPAGAIADGSANAPGTAASKKKKKSTPMQNLKDVMDALDIMIEEAEKKVVKKYRPNMFAEFKQLNDTGGKVSRDVSGIMRV